jgi:hypothetical protein
MVESAPTAPARPRRSFSPEVPPAVLTGIGVQAFLFLLTALVLDHGRTNQFCCIGLIAHWLGVLMILGRRPRSPTQGDLWFIRWGAVLLLLAMPWVADLVYALIGKSSLSGLERLSGVSLRRGLR